MYNNFETAAPKFLSLKHGSYYSAEVIFPDFSLTFQDKMNRFPWLICSREIPTSAFNRLQSHYKQKVAEPI